MTWANRLTTGRLAMALLLFLLFALHRCWPAVGWLPWVFPLLVVGSILTDLLDGRLARRHGECSGFGHLYDPFADSIFRFTAFLCLWWIGWASAWMLVILFLHDATVSFLRVIACGQDRPLLHWSSNLPKEAAQELAMLIGLTLYAVPAWRPSPLVGRIAWWLLLCATLVTVWSSLQAVWTNRQALRDMEK